MHVLANFISTKLSRNSAFTHPINTELELPRQEQIKLLQIQMAHPKPHAIVIPYPYQGHVTPMINLSISLASRGFTITFVQIEFIHHFISKAQNLPAAADHADFFGEARKSGLDIRYTTISDGFPVEFDRDVNFEEVWESMLRDFPDRVDEIVVETMKADESAPETTPRPPFLLIADTFYTWPATIAKKHDMVYVSLWTEPAIVFSLNYHLELLTQNGHVPYNGHADNHINYIPGIQSITTRDLMTYLQDPELIPMLTQIVKKGFEQVKKADFILCNTVEELESEALSALNHKHPTYAIGPINFYTDFTKTSIAKSFWSEFDCTQWLNSKPSGSVLYVSFGSMAESNNDEIAELAHGLLLSEVYFIWVLRPNITRGNGTDILPEGFEDGLKDKGLVVPWCNQNTVLSSPAVGGFLTHCGWNSILESIWYDVPMICYPLIVDQPTNRKLVVDDWKIGVDLCDGEQVGKEEVASKINTFMMRGGSSVQMKQEMKKVSKNLHDALGVEGSSHRNFDRFVEDLKAKLYMRSP
ncbi:UNVERIFIED_CONTAM: UDP-glycosyltransferase 86A1 [Sesamum radiatum]|uniref:Glycosyltransferase n=1 Tax=Sesamum radiatum TaxID=300843 RepID=A0AAW2S6K0_SESRA